jgi:hypothetical protein
VTAQPIRDVQNLGLSKSGYYNFGRRGRSCQLGDE